jgi:hypothetical protein
MKTKLIQNNCMLGVLILLNLMLTFPSNGQSKSHRVTVDSILVDKIVFRTDRYGPLGEICIMNPDGMTDRKKFRELVSDRMAMMGDVPSSMFAAGTPEDIYKYVRDLVSLFDSRGLILCPGCDAPINTKPENMKAFIAASHRFGSPKA